MSRDGPRGEGRFFDSVYALVREIPRGRVATYGQLAALLGVSRGARAVGWALRALHGRPAARVPWHRVVGAGGRISLPAFRGGHLQRTRLRAEGVRFAGNRVDLARHSLLAPALELTPRRASATQSRPTRGRRRVSLARWRSRRATVSSSEAESTRPR